MRNLMFSALGVAFVWMYQQNKDLDNQLYYTQQRLSRLERQLYQIENHLAVVKE